MLNRLLNGAVDVFERLAGIAADARARRRLSRLRELGMTIGPHVNLPPSTWIDTAHCYLISIGEGCHFGPHCLILAHDAQMDEFLDAGRIGPVVIGDGCRIGARSVILCNVEIGPGTIVEVGSVVSTSLPEGTYCAGAPARPVSTVEEYSARVFETVKDRPVYRSDDFRALLDDAESRTRLREELRENGPVLLSRSKDG